MGLPLYFHTHIYYKPPVIGVCPPLPPPPSIKNLSIVVFSLEKPDKKTLIRLDALEKTTQRQIVAIKYKQEQLECENDELERQGITSDMITNKIKMEEANLITINEKRTNKGKDLDQYSKRQAETFEAIAQNDRQRSKLIEEIAMKEAEIGDLEGSAKRGFGRRKSIFELVVNRASIEKITQVIS